MFNILGIFFQLSQKLVDTAFSRQWMPNRPPLRKVARRTGTIATLAL
jgi:hypothetical protein